MSVHLFITVCPCGYLDRRGTKLAAHAQALKHEEQSKQLKKKECCVAVLHVEQADDGWCCIRDVEWRADVNNSLASTPIKVPSLLGRLLVFLFGYKRRVRI